MRGVVKDSPALRKWIGDTVGGEGETLDRHDRWLCMLYPRLALRREFLSEDGNVFITLDDNEIRALRYVMDEVFGAMETIGCPIGPTFHEEPIPLACPRTCSIAW